MLESILMLITYYSKRLLKQNLGQEEFDLLCKISLMSKKSYIDLQKPSMRLDRHKLTG